MKKAICLLLVACLMNSTPIYKVKAETPTVGWIDDNKEGSSGNTEQYITPEPTITVEPTIVTGDAVTTNEPITTVEPTITVAPTITPANTSEPEVKEGVDVDYTGDKATITVSAKSKAEAKKKGLKVAKADIKNMGIDSKLVTIKFLEVYKVTSTTYRYCYKLHFKYNTSDSAFKPYSRECEDVIEDIYDNNAENSYWANRYKSKRKKVNKVKYTKLTTRYFKASIDSPLGLSSYLMGKSRAFKQKYLRLTSLNSYGTIYGGADGNGLIGIYGDAKINNLCNADDLPVGICSRVTSVMPSTKVYVLYEYSNGWSMVQFKYTTKSNTTGALTKTGTYFIRTSNLTSSKKKSVPIANGTYKTAKGNDLTKTLYGYSRKYMLKVYNKRTARSKWIASHRRYSENAELTDDMLSYMYSLIDNKTIKNNLDSDSFTTRQIVYYVNGERKIVAYWTSRTMFAARDKFTGYGGALHDARY